MSDEVMRALNNCPTTHLTNLARGFSSPSVMELLGPRILCYIHWQKNFLLMKEMATSGHLRKMTVDDYGISASMVHRADYHLLGLPYLTQLSPLQNLVRLALLISDMSSFIGLPPGTMFIGVLALQLKRALKAMDLSRLEYFDEDIVRLILWACFLGVELTMGLEDQAWFLSHLSQGQKVLKLPKRDEVLGLLASFMYTEDRFVKTAGIVWTDLREVDEDERSTEPK